MEEKWIKFAVSWYDKQPLPKALNVYRIFGGVDLADGKATFKLKRTGNNVTVDIDQLFNISAIEKEP